MYEYLCTTTAVNSYLVIENLPHQGELSVPPRCNNILCRESQAFYEGSAARNNASSAS